MNVQELNNVQKKAMNKDLIKDHYEWNDKYLFSYLLGELPLEIEDRRYIGKEFSREQISKNEIIKKINEIINKYNYNMKIEKKYIDKLEYYYSELGKYKEKLYTNYSEVKKILKFNKILFISGPGGIGKSQFLYEFSEKIDKRFKCLCVYGKFCENIPDNIYSQIIKLTQNERFYLIIDAINEFKVEIRKKIIEFIKSNKENENLRIIISYRDFSMNVNEIENIKHIIDEEEIFTGIDPEYALEKIAEKYNLDLSIYEKLLYDNNPLHLKLIIKRISNNKLAGKSLQPITKGTFIYEQFVEEVLSRKEWEITKNIVEIMFEKREKELKSDDLKQILSTDFEAYIDKMKTNNFIGTYEFEENTYIYFTNETLTDYLIARFLMDKIKDLDEREIKRYINQIVEIFYSIKDKIILMLFEKYKNNIQFVIKIIQETKLIANLDLELFNELNIDEKDITEIHKIFKYNYDLKKLLIIAGGNENNPFNCKNYINNRLKKIKSINLF